MLTRDGVKLLDFGLARLQDRHEQVLTDPTQFARLTDVGTILGTVPYMAPERIEGGTVDARTDLFAGGVVLYEMVAGRRPFVGDRRASLMPTIVATEPHAAVVVAAADTVGPRAADSSWTSPVTQPTCDSRVRRCGYGGGRVRRR